MILKIQQSILNKALQICSKAAGSFVLASGCFHFKSGINELQISCCNNEYSISTEIPADFKGNIDILIPADKLKAWVSSIPDQLISMDIDNLQVKITAGKSTCIISGYSGEDMPQIKHIPNGKFNIPFSDLSEAINQTAYARSVNSGNGDIRSGLSVEFEKDKTAFFATNGDRMALHYLDAVIKANNMILPYNFVSLLNSLQFNTDANVSASDSSLQIISNGYTITGILMDGKYFDWRRSIPKYENHIEFDKQELLIAVKRVLLVGDNNTSKIVFTFNEYVELVASDINLNQSGTEILSTKYTGDQFKIAFSGKYLLDIITHIEGDIVVLEYGTPLQPGIFKSETGSKNFAAAGVMVV